MEVSRLLNRLLATTASPTPLLQSPQAGSDFGPMGLNLVHDISSSMSAMLLDIERLQLDADAIQQSIRQAQEQILSLQESRIYVRKELRTCVKEYSKVCEESKVSLTLYASNEFVVAGNPAKFRVVIGNLIRNAIDSTRQTSNADIHLRLTNLDNTVLVRVIDNGIGISLAQQAKIFTAGYTTKPTGNHMGLGLNLVRQIVEKDFGGSIRVQSSNNGTVFSLHLPTTQDG